MPEVDLSPEVVTFSMNGEGHTLTANFEQGRLLLASNEDDADAKSRQALTTLNEQSAREEVPEDQMQQVRAVEPRVAAAVAEAFQNRDDGQAYRTESRALLRRIADLLTTYGTTHRVMEVIDPCLPSLPRRSAATAHSWARRSETRTAPPRNRTTSPRSSLP